MRSKQLLAALLLGVGLCFVPVLGHGEVKRWLYEVNAPHMNVFLLESRVNYMMTNPTIFLLVSFYYDLDGSYGRLEELPDSIDTKGKVYVRVQDNRGLFSSKSGIALLDLFKRALELIYLHLSIVAMDMDTDIVATLYSGQEIPLAYFYQGEYHLWEK